MEAGVGGVAPVAIGVTALEIDDRSDTRTIALGEHPYVEYPDIFRITRIGGIKRGVHCA
jgi:hypothetical protein